MIALQAFEDEQAQATALALDVAKALSQLLIEDINRRITLAVSGGKSPKIFLQALSSCELEWERIDITLIDDRWVPHTDLASNARLVEKTLLQHNAARAQFFPLVNTQLDSKISLKKLNEFSLPNKPDVAVLGMGDDGHIASLFSDAPEWQHAMTTSERFVLIHPKSAPYARISWSFSIIKEIKISFLQISGAKKLKTLNNSTSHLVDNAISKLAHEKGEKLDVYWFP